MWRNWNPLNPPVNEQSSEEENYGSPGSGIDPNELVSPNRPHQSASASPRALLRPDPPPVEEVLEQATRRLQTLPSREQRAANRNAHRQAQEAAEAAAERAAAAAVIMVDFDQQNTEDGDKANELARSIKVEFNPIDVRFWFSELEAEMLTANINKQWLKKTVLQRNLPTKQKEDVKALLTLNQTQAGNDIYYRIKTELIRIYAPKPKDSYVKALSRSMVGLPSQLGHQLVNDVCKKSTKLQGCCCAAAVEALWHLQLPVTIRAHVSNMAFDHTTYKNVFEAADQVFLSSKQVTVAAVQVAAAQLDETLPAFNSQNQPQQEVAAVARGGGRGRGGRGGRRNNRGGARGATSGTSRGGGQSNQNSRGQKHSSVPDSQADKMCSRHYAHGDQAWYCLAPTTCPWVNKVIARTT